MIPILGSRRTFLPALLLTTLLLAHALPSTAAAVRFGMRPQPADGRFMGWDAFAQLLIEEFNKLHPEITVEYEPLIGNWTEQMTVRFAAGTAPDVMEMWGSFAVNWAELGLLMDLRPFIETQLGDEVRDFFPHQFRAGTVLQGPHKGEVYGIPRYANTSTLFYNKSAFDRAGLPYLNVVDDAGEWTWETFLEFAKKLTIREGDVVRQWGYDIPNNSLHRVASWVWGNGGKIFDYPDNPTVFLLDQPEAIEGLEFYHDLVWRHGVAPALTDGGVTGFQNGEIAMLDQGTFLLGQFRNTIGDSFEWDLGPRPVGRGGRGYWIAADFYGVNRNAQNPNEALTFLKFLVSKEAVDMQTRSIGLLPSRISGLEELQRVFPDLSVEYHIRSAVEANVLFNSVAVHAREADLLTRPVIVATMRNNEKPVAAAIAEVAPLVRALYEE